MGVRPWRCWWRRPALRFRLTRHHTLLKAARVLRRLVGGGELAGDDARAALLDAAGGHVGVDGCTAVEVHQTINDGLAYGRRLPPLYYPSERCW
ncbi:MAG: hypothetical protein ACRDRE_25335 [Pseudonocardiaceae bacterium]